MKCKICLKQGQLKFCSNTEISVLYPEIQVIIPKELSDKEKSMLMFLLRKEYAGNYDWKENKFRIRISSFTTKEEAKEKILRVLAKIEEFLISLEKAFEDEITKEKTKIEKLNKLAHDVCSELPGICSKIIRGNIDVKENFLVCETKTKILCKLPSVKMDYNLESLINNACSYSTVVCYSFDRQTGYLLEFIIDKEESKEIIINHIKRDMEAVKEVIFEYIKEDYKSKKYKIELANEIAEQIYQDLIEKLRKKKIQ